MIRQVFVSLVLSVSILFQSGLAFAEPRIFEIQMISEGGEKLFVPEYLEVSVGDTVRFVNVSGNHNTESMRGMIPEGAAHWKSKLRATFDLKISHDGVYAYRCTPHYRQAMVGLIVAGNPHANLEEAKQAYTISKVAEVFDRLFAKAEKIEN